jgi:hypothetical protein
MSLLKLLEGINNIHKMMDRKQQTLYSRKGFEVPNT